MSAAYDEQFFRRQRELSGRSAARMLPVVLDLVRPGSVVDVGCGVGSWLEVAMRLGVEEVLGVDGGYVDRRWLRIPAERFTVRDLPQPLSLPQTFDLTLSLEVAEHLPHARADSFVFDLCALAPVVLFSAALPQQGGVEHINEQWPDYWVERFERADYQLIDCLRPRFWSDPEVEYYFAQNAMLFVAPGELPDEVRGPRMPLRAVHPELLARRTRVSAFSVRSLLRAQGDLLTAVPQAIRTTAASWRRRHAT
jgi:SAM-dependent methyltransferase